VVAQWSAEGSLGGPRCAPRTQLVHGAHGRPGVETGKRWECVIIKSQSKLRELPFQRRLRRLEASIDVLLNLRFACLGQQF
jgi:hypothetical protein